MKIIQTLWTGKKDLLKDHFGWQSAQHHIMGWTLSCLKLNEFYDDVHLYTDSKGVAILVDYLNLPYKVTLLPKAIDIFSNEIWAVSKILTFSLQEEPFLHVDGDVFIWNKFDSSIEEARLVTQNYEYDEGLYERLMKAVIESLQYIPGHLKAALAEKPIRSYNTGIFGGNDLDFIKEFCRRSLDLVERNIQAIHELPQDFNLLFEQILLHNIVVEKNKEVVSVLKDSATDQYLFYDLADFSDVPDRLTYLHLIGHHKRNHEICDLMSRTLLKEFPDYYYKVAGLFNFTHINFHSKIKQFVQFNAESNISNNYLLRDSADFSYYFRTKRSFAIDNPENKTVSLQEIRSYVETSDSITTKTIFEFENQLTKIFENWQSIPPSTLADQASKSMNYRSFFLKKKEDQLLAVVQRNTFLEVIDNSYDWDTETKTAISPHLVNNFNDMLGLAYIPQLFFNGYREIVIDEIHHNILAILEMPMRLGELVSRLKQLFLAETSDEIDFYPLILPKIKYLCFNQCLFIQP